MKRIRLSAVIINDAPFLTPWNGQQLQRRTFCSIEREKSCAQESAIERQKMNLKPGWELVSDWLNLLSFILMCWLCWTANQSVLVWVFSFEYSFAGGVNGSLLVFYSCLFVRAIEAEICGLENNKRFILGRVYPYLTRYFVRTEHGMY